METKFRNRHEAGKFLAGKLRRLADSPGVIVLGLPRGGIPVAYEIASELNAPLDIFLVRKLGVPMYGELAMGAIASGGVRVLNEDVIRQLGISQEMIESVTAEEQRELARREFLYRRGREPLDVTGRTIVLVDDGLATGATMRAAARALRQRNPRRLIVAVPVGAEDTCASFQNEADEVVCGKMPDEFRAVGAWYEDFTQTTDEEVRELLDRTAMAHQ